MTKFWIQDPTILMKSNEKLTIWPSVNMNKNENLNAITRLIIILSVLGYIITRNNKIPLSGFISMLAIIILYNSDKVTLPLHISDSKEGFNADISHDDPFGGGGFTEPTPTNPLMNVMLNELNENPNRKPAAPSFNPVVENEINNATQEFVAKEFDDPNIDEKLFKDLGDSFDFNQSMRAWHPMPNTQCPNDQKSFADFCYGGMTSCKEGNSIACSQTADSRWIN